MIIITHKRNTVHFQSPFHRGIGCYAQFCPRLSPLFDFQSPFHRGIGCYSVGVYFEYTVQIFQSPFHRAIGCYIGDLKYEQVIRDLSVPFSSGHRLLLESGRMGQTATTAVLSVPFSSGHRLLHPRSRHSAQHGSGFQSPFHRGIDCY